MPDSIPITSTIDATGRVTLATLAGLGIARGNASFNAAFGNNVVAIPHGLGVQPKYSNVRAVDFNGNDSPASLVSMDATNINWNILANSGGTMTYYWEAIA